MAGSKERMLYF